jgi:hypothetical protein
MPQVVPSRYLTAVLRYITAALVGDEMAMGRRKEHGDLLQRTLGSIIMTDCNKKGKV